MMRSSWLRTVPQGPFGATLDGMKTLVRLADFRGIAWWIALLGLSVSVLFTFAIYPLIGDTHHAVLDPDLHGPLGFGIWKYHAFAYYPNTASTAARGPLYPTFVAACLASSGGWWPYSVQLAQCFLFGAMCALVFFTARRLWNPPLAVLAAGLCAIDPFLIWYTSRIWVEPLMMFLFTALVASIVKVKQQPSAVGAVLVGLILGASVMTKSVYTPFLVLTPLLCALPFGRRLSFPLVLVMLVCALLVVTPWTLRNGRLTGIYAPEVGNTGFTLHQGNDFVEDFGRAPFSVSALYPISLARMRAEADEVDFAPGSTGLQMYNALDAARRRVAVDKMVGSPAFFAKKILYDTFLFWTLGDSAAKSFFIALVQLPLVALFCATLIVRRQRLLHGPAGICAALVCLFYCAHLPTISLARYSAVLVPAMLIVGVGFFHGSFASQRSANAELLA